MKLKQLTFSVDTAERVQLLLRVIILIGIAAVAISSRLFSVVRFESIIHEFDPWFNFRATKYLVNNGFYKFLNWFDDRTWYPLGRVTGGTLYPGLMVTSGIIHKILHIFSLPIDIRNICVLLAPAFSGLTAYATYLFTKEMKNEAAGLLAAAFMGIAPGYISRSVAGSYDNEAIAIFLLMITFYLWIKAIKLGSVFWGATCAMFYFYMVAAWGGYVFITNMIPVHVFVLLLMGRYNDRIYVAYSSWYALGTLASMQIPFVGFLPIRSSEHMGALGVFGLLQLVAFSQFLRNQLSPKLFKRILISSVIGIITLAGLALTAMTYAGVIAPWGGRFYSLWDTNYAKVHIPIIASVSEHQPTAWPSFFFDTHMLVWLFPAGIYLIFQELRDEHLFVIVYAVLGSYFAGVMVRLMLTLTPVICVSAAVAINTLFEMYTNFTIDGVKCTLTITNKQNIIEEPTQVAGKKESETKVEESDKEFYLGLVGKFAVITSFALYLFMFVIHCTWVTSNAYSSPSVVLASRNPDGSQLLIDDFREAYYWLRMNTEEDARVMSWWDYGYQIGGMADRTTLVDNNTWNNTHIATVGKAMASSEEKAYPILRKHDVDYILVVFGGHLGYSGDDINKFLWMVRISEGIWPEDIKERLFFTDKGEYKVDGEATQTMRDSLLYKMSYYNYPDLYASINNGAGGYDRVRQQTIPMSVSPKLNVIEEAFTSENWIVRIYKVKDLDNMGRDLFKATAFDEGRNKKKRKASSSDKKAATLRV
ncbi:STT3 subunit of Oligosaccharyl transferase [Nadsonia fulvescens var. elongata DSM 6958]|uniref:Dolichyl-diphosphooligosaccharide--protein glycosyltransferase subunit STT3 n=1 Tax=Nadsonia fulvescens var. elongata DSM 6958 TaxID=857566 RepID=A0A1E3PTG2_9ASCO|nr:STT3 subunit of Oligosaccharyl transferase [Nadsonia fulvescens var. elongata DSM 6958]